MAIRPVVVSFQSEGVRDVTRSFQTIANAAANAEKASIRSHDNVANRAVKSYARTTDAKKREVKAAESADAKLEQSKRKLASQIETIERRQSDRRMREIEREVKQAIKADDARVKAAKRASDQIEKIRAKEVAAARRIGDGIGRTVGGSVRGVIGGASRLASTALAVGGGFSIVDSLQDTIRNRGKAAEIALNSGKDGLTRDGLLHQANSIAMSRGFEVSQVLAGVDRFGATSGDYKNAPKVIDQIAALANATGGSIEELSGAAGLFQANGGDASRTQEWLRVSAGMGRAGSVDVRDLAQYGAKVSSASGQFADQGAAFVDLSAMTQMAVKRGGAEDAATATTAVARYAGDIWKNEDAIKGMGVKTRDATGKKLNSASGIMFDAISATQGDRGKLGSVFKLESIKAIEGYRQTYNDAAIASKAKGGTASDQDTAGRKAMAETLQAMRDAAMTEEQVKTEAAKRMEETDKKLIAVFEKLKIEVGEKLAPKFMELIPVLEKAIPAFTEMLDFATKNPFSSVALLMGAAVTKDIAAAGIGKGIEFGVSKAATAIASGGMGLQTSLGSVSFVIAAAAIALQQGIAHIDEMFAKKTAEQTGDALRGGSIEEKRAALLDKVRSGKASAADIEQAKKDLVGAEGGLAEQGKRLDPENKSLTEKLVGGMGQGAIGKALGMDEAMAAEDASARAEFSRTKQSIESFAKAIEASTKALEEHAKKTGGSPGGKSDPGSPVRGKPQTSPERSGHN